MKSAAAITFDYRPSRWLQFGLSGAAVLAVLAVAASGIGVVPKALAIAATAAAFAFELRRLRRPIIACCAWHADGQWRVRDTSGNDHAAALLQSSVRGVLIVLRLRVPTHGSVALVLLPDNCDEPTRRQLRVRLARGADNVSA